MDHGSHHDHAHHHEVDTTIVPATTENLHIDHSIHDGHGAASVADHSMHSMMSMTFHGGYNEIVLFDWWKIDSVAGLIGSVIAIFMFAVLYEGLKYYRDQLFWKSCNSLQYRAVQQPEEKASPSDEPRVVHVGGVFRNQQPTMCSKFHLWQTLLHAVQVFISYLLMLIFMTFNVYLCMAVVAGAACGNFLFGWKRSVVVDVTEHCH